jgi:thioredoxin reductase (NADPH)
LCYLRLFAAIGRLICDGAKTNVFPSVHYQLPHMPQTDNVIIIGSGPAGIAVAATLQAAGHTVTIYDKGSMAQAVTQWPIYMEFFSTAANVELPGMPLIITRDKPTREEYLNYLRRYVQEKNLHIVTGHTVENIEKQPDGTFIISGHDEWGQPFSAPARYVVVATGAYEIPKLLNVPGEDLHKVSHYYTEVHPYVGKDVMVVGGRNGAAEAALLFYRAGARVTLVYRGARLQPLKWWLQPDLENRIANGEIKAYFGTTVVEITPHTVVLETSDGHRETVPNDFVVAMTGYRPETSLLQNAGVKIDPATNRPSIDPDTLETNVPGLFVAGVIAAGDISNEIFIENSRTHGENILRGIRKDEHTNTRTLSSAQ